MSDKGDKKEEKELSRQRLKKAFSALLPVFTNANAIAGVPLPDLAMCLHDLKDTTMGAHLEKIVREHRKDYLALEAAYHAAIEQQDATAIREILLQGYVPKNLYDFIGARKLIRGDGVLSLVEIVIFPEFREKPAIESFLTADKLLALGAPLPRAPHKDNDDVSSRYSLNSVFIKIIADPESILRHPDIRILYLALRNDPAFLTKQEPKSGDTLLHHMARFYSISVGSEAYAIALDWIFDGRLVDLTIQNKAGETPIQLLIENTGSSPAEQLICARFVQAAIKSQFTGLNINQLFSERTLFYRVVSLIRDMPDMIQLAESLLDHGADPTLCGSESYNAIAALRSVPKYFADGVKFWGDAIQRLQGDDESSIENRREWGQKKQKDEQALLNVEALVKRVNEYAAKKAHENKPSVISSSVSSSSLQHPPGRHSSSSELSRETPKPNGDSGVNEVADDVAEREQKQSVAPVGGSLLSGQKNVSVPSGHTSFLASPVHSIPSTLNSSSSGSLSDSASSEQRDEAAGVSGTAVEQQAQQQSL
jgi:hypothetical protein